MQCAPPALDRTYGFGRRSKDLVDVYFNYASSVIMLLRVPVLARPQHSGPIAKLHAASVASSSFALVYEPGI